MVIFIVGKVQIALNPNGVGVTAIAIWGGQDMPVGSRMTFGPFEIAENSEATLGFFTVLC